MDEQNDSFGNGILKGLKKVLFNSDNASALSSDKRITEPAGVEKGQTIPSGSNDSSETDPASKNMKLKVYQLLENMNKPGVDFFEVWNAAVEMGGASSSNLKSAFTSLRFADKTLTKSKLLSTGKEYMDGLKNVIASESQKRLDEKTRLEKEREELKSKLVTEINELEKQVAALQEKLTLKKTENSRVHETYEPKIKDIDIKIQAGQQSVNNVLQEMLQVIDTINKDLN